MKPVRVLAVSGGKGGIGKTNVAVNLSLAMAAQNKEVLLLDADLGLANVDVLLGLNPSKNISHVLSGECSLDEVIIKGPGGISIIPASSGTQSLTRLSNTEHAGLIGAFSELKNPLDVLVVDTAAGISDSVVSFTCAAQEVLIVVCDEPTSITDAYASIKVLSREHGISKFRILANMVSTNQQGRELFSKLLRATDRFLDVTLDFVGAIPYDDNLRKAVQKQKSVFLSYPSSRASVAFKTLALRINNWPEPEGAGDHIAFFLERLIQHA